MNPGIVAQRAELTERRSAKIESIGILSAQVEKDAAEFQMSKDNPTGKLMPAKQYADYKLACQSIDMQTHDVVMLDYALRRLEAIETPEAEFSTRRLQAMRAWSKGETLSAEQTDEFITPANSDDAARFPSGGAQFKVRAAMTRSGAGADTSGATAVPELTEPNVLVENMVAFGGVAQLVSVMRTDHGRNIEVPNVDTTAQVGIRMAEGVNAADLDMPDLGSTILKAWIYGSKVATVTHQLLRDASFNIVEWTERSLIQRNARVIESECTLGTGADRPTGIIDQLKVGITAADDETFTWPELLDLSATIDDAYLAPAGHGLGAGGEVAFGMNKTTMIKIMQLADTQNRPLYLPDIRGGMSFQLFGYPMRKVYGMADIAADAQPIAFGNFGFYVMRVTEESRLLRFDDSVYAKGNKTGFLVFNEADGRWIQKLDANSKITCAQLLQMGA